MRANLPMEPVKIPLHATHSLSMFGYHLKDVDMQRRRTALENAVAYWGPTYVIRKLNVLAIYRKNRFIVQGRRARADMRYVQKVFGTPRRIPRKTLKAPTTPKARTPRRTTDRK